MRSTTTSLAPAAGSTLTHAAPLPVVGTRPGVATRSTTVRGEAAVAGRATLGPIRPRSLRHTRPAPERHAPGGLHLTRRGRRLVRVVLWTFLTAAAAVLLVAAWLGVAATVAPGAVAGDGGSGVGSGLHGAAGQTEVDTAEVVVAPGDTLWQIARSSAPDRDPRSVVGQIVSINGLTSTGVQVGAVLEVPTA